ncbi:unnamed protein product [Camellia sinensis]
MLDFDIPFCLAFVYVAVIELLTIIGIMASVTWQVLIVAVDKPLQRELMQIDGTTKASVMNYASETSLGVVTIRAFNMADDKFFENHLKLTDTDAKLFFYSNATLEWSILRVETLQNITLFTAAFLLCNCGGQRPPSSWPSKGKVALHDLKIRYQLNAPLVLKGITCTFIEGTKVGIVGRTGSGKTTLICALFRLVEPDSGKILIDGLDICSIGLKDLRMKLSIIPQEPTLFKGTMRMNLDPLGLYSDDVIWLWRSANLRLPSAAFPNLLDSSAMKARTGVWANTSSSVLAVLLRRNRILVLDEATASIDFDTDATLQRIIKEELSNCTVITIAHRVTTVIDSDMVMVLSFGELVEYDEPSKLMETNSSFSMLVAEYRSSYRRNSEL